MTYYRQQNQKTNKTAVDPSHMNRAQKRAYEKAYRHDRMAAYCKVCGFKTRYLAIANPQATGKCDIICEVCRTKRYSTPLPGLTANEYVNVNPLDEAFIKASEKRSEEPNELSIGKTQGDPNS